MAAFPAPNGGIVLTHFIVSADVDRSRRFYTDVLGGEAVLEGEPTIVALGNSWIIINLGGPPTDRGRELRCYIRDPDGHLLEGRPNHRDRRSGEITPDALRKGTPRLIGASCDLNYETVTSRSSPPPSSQTCNGVGAMAELTLSWWVTRCQPGRSRAGDAAAAFCGCEGSPSRRAGRFAVSSGEARCAARG